MCYGDGSVPRVKRRSARILPIPTFRKVAALEGALRERLRILDERLSALGDEKRSIEQERREVIERLAGLVERLAELEEMIRANQKPEEPVEVPPAAPTLRANKIPGLIVDVLSRDPSKDWSAGELAELLRKDEAQVRVTLARLEKLRRVRRVSIGRYAAKPPEIEREPP